MPWKRNKEPDPLEARRRQIADAERNLQDQRRKLAEQIHGSPTTRNKTSAEPPVWRREEDGPVRPAETSAARRRHLARQRQRDMIVFFIFIAVLVIVLIAAYWIAYGHNSNSLPGT